MPAKLLCLFEKAKYITSKITMKKMIWLWIVLIIITGIFIFSKPGKVSQAYKDGSSVERFYSQQVGGDRALLIDDPFESGLARIKVIQNAKKSLDISYYAIHPGTSTDSFFGALIEAADRGVQVNLLLDGIVHGLRGQLRDIFLVFDAHPNMNLKLYEPMNLFKPWTLNNRLHDKYILADREIAIIGGRNIGDQYFNPEGYEKEISNDRDVVIINLNSEEKTSAIYQLAEYFELIWNHSYSKSKNRRWSEKQYLRASQKSDLLKEDWETVKDQNQDFFAKEIDWAKKSLPTNKITLLTNSLQATPNLPAYSGYLLYRKKIIDAGVRVFEYQGVDSIHGKAFVIDDELALIGSFNTDPRSAFLSTETMAVVHSPEIVASFKENIQADIDQSLEVAADYTYIEKAGVEPGQVSRAKKVIIKLLSYITKWFDYML